MPAIQLWFLALAHLTIDFFLNILPPVMPFFVREFGLSVTAVAALMTAKSAGSGLLQPVFGSLIDRSRRTTMLPVTIIWCGTLTALLGVLSGYWLLLGAALLAGLAGAVFHPLATVSVRALMGRYSAGAMSIFGVGGTIGMALVPLVATGLVTRYGLRGMLWLLVPAFGVAGILALRGLHRLDIRRPAVDSFGVASTDAATGAAGGGSMDASPEGSMDASPEGSAAASAKATPDASPEASPTSSAPVAAAPITPLVYLTVATLVRTIGQVALTSFLPLYYVSKGFSEGYGSVMLTVHLVAGSLSAMGSGYLSDRWGRRPVVIASTVLATPALLGFLATGGVLQGVMLVIVSLCLFATFSVVPVYAQELVPDRAGMAAGLMMGGVWSVAAFCLIPLGALADAFDLHTALMVGAFLPLISAVFLLPVPETHRVGAMAMPTVER